MAIFPSEEWLAEYIGLVNVSGRFADAARTFTAEISYVFEREDGSGLQADIWASAGVGDGRVHWWRYDVTPDKGGKAEFILRAPYSMWKRVIAGEVDPMEAMMDGDLAVTGHLPTLLRYVRAANELVHLATKVDTQFADEISPAVDGQS